MDEVKPAQIPADAKPKRKPMPKSVRWAIAIGAVLLILFIQSWAHGMELRRTKEADAVSAAKALAAGSADQIIGRDPGTAQRELQAQIRAGEFEKGSIIMDGKVWATTDLNDKGKVRDDLKNFTDGVRTHREGPYFIVSVPVSLGGNNVIGSFELTSRIP